MKKKNIKKLVYLTLIIVSIIYTVYQNELNKKVKNDNNIEKRIETIKVSNEDELKISFIDVGQADSILIQEKENNILVDAGNNEDGEKLVNYFKNLDITNFKYVFGTHAHEDHIGGMDNIINNFKIDKFYMPEAITTTKTFEDILDSLENNNIRFNTPKIDEKLNLDNLIINILYVGEDEKDLNNTSIVLKITYYNTSFLLTGDATSKTEKYILNKNIKSDVLKIGHHGSQYSTTNEFLDKVDPKYAIISVGKNNTYDHPKDITIKKLQDKNIKIYRTDIDHTIIMKSDGNNIKIETEKTDTNG